MSNNEDTVHDEQSGGGLFSANDVDELMEKEEEEEDQEEVPTQKRNSETTEEGEPSRKKTHKDEEDPVLEKTKPPSATLPEKTREDKTLEEVLELMDDEDFTPIIPDAVTDYYLAKNGFATSNKKIKRLLALATQKFISDIATDAYEYSRIRSNSTVYNSANPQVRARALMMATMMNSQGQNQNSGEDGGEGENTLSGTLGGNAGQAQNNKVTLTMEDVTSALEEYGLSAKRPQFYR